MPTRSAILHLMSDAGRKVVHDLIEELPEDELPEIRSLLEARVRRHVEASPARAARLTAMEKIEQTWQGQPSTTPEQVRGWIIQSRP